MTIFNTKPLIHIEQRKLLYFDSEYSDQSNESVYPICCCFKNQEVLQEYWFNGDNASEHSKKDILQLISKYTLVAHFALAETRFLMSILGFLPDDLQIVDTFADYKLACNKHTTWNWGKQLKAGKVIYTRPPSPEEKKASKTLEGASVKANTGDASASLSSMVYKIHYELEKQEVFIDAERKDAMRDICIEADEDKLTVYRKEVQLYCLDDVEKLMNAWTLWMDKSNMWDYSESVERGDYAISLAYCMKVGIPMDVPKLEKLRDNRETIVKLAKQRFVEETGLPLYRGEESLEVRKDGKGFTSVSKNKIGTKNASVMHDYILARYPEWALSEKTKLPSLEDDNLERYDFDKVINAYRQTEKSIRALNSLNQFKGDGDEKDSYLMNAVGVDGRIRCLLGPWGTLTGRNAPKASVFPLALAKWFRALIVPPKGWALVEADYMSCENLLSGIVYNDQKVVDAYCSGDVYLAFGKQAGILPPEATKKTHAVQRQQLKSVVLGCGYGMGKALLSRHFCVNTWKGATSPDKFKEEWKAHCEEMTPVAEDMLCAFKETYYDMFEARQEAWVEFEDTGVMPISRCWRVFDGLPFYNTILNAPVQGISAEIMRRFSRLLTRGAPECVKYFSPLHDAAYCLVRLDKLLEGTEFICKQMLDACKDVVTDPRINHMRVGIDIISPELSIKELDTAYGKAVVTPIFFADENAERSYDRYLPYMATSGEDLKRIWGEKFQEMY